MPCVTGASFSRPTQTIPIRYTRTWRRPERHRSSQLWVADITYIRLETEFVYPAVILGAFSRRVVDWALDRTLEAVLGKCCICASGKLAG
jgi:transposase InsO family protein